MKWKVLDTFSGAGGFSLGFHLAGCEIVGAVEIDSWAAETFQFNHPGAKMLIGDIKLFTNDYLSRCFVKNKPNIVLGGPPCQGFSICNKNAGDPYDPRNSLFKEFIRVGSLFRPDFLIMENVPNLVKARTNTKELVINIISKELERIGYNVYWDILEATSYGIPQIRRRLFIIASLEKLNNPFPHPTHYIPDEQASLFNLHLKTCPSLWEAISDLPEIEAGEGCEEMAYDVPTSNEYQNTLRNNSKKVFNHVGMQHGNRMVERFASMKWGESVSDVPEHLRPFKRNGNGEISSKTYDQNNRRMHPQKPCHTIPASFYANFVHPYKNRNFTAREGARIQSFPDWFIFKGKPTIISHKLLQKEGRLDEKHLCQYNQIGNAVPPLLVKKIAENLLK